MNGKGDKWRKTDYTKYRNGFEEINWRMNKHFVLPKTYFIGYTAVDLDALTEYLTDTDQLEFLQDIKEAQDRGLNGGEILCSFYAKACYSSLTTKKNKNISKTRDIYNNIIGILDSGHGSVLEHCNLNFMVTNCSRIFTHELVRHRVGTAFSQTSGRYVRSDVLNVVIDPILEPAYDLVEEARKYLESWYKRMEERLGIEQVKEFALKKKLTSAMRRMLPNGQSNEMGVTLNIRSLRHTIENRTSEHAEWEIRYIYNQIYKLVKGKYPVMFIDAQTETKDGLLEIKFKNRKV
jgi:thymidylate synthase (FAD)